jgi:dihydropteroate synthase
VLTDRPDRAQVMGVVNVTPDSFSDGGLFIDPEAAIDHGRRLAADGADLLDVGGESTRPGAETVSAEEELRRVVPVVEGLGGGPARVSIDTSKRRVAEAALGAGAQIVNDVTALRGDPELAGLCADRGCDVVLMHMLGTPRTMQDDPAYEDVVDDVKAFLAERIELAAEHNLELLRRLGELRDLGRPICVGTSRKSFIGKITGRPVDQRVGGTVASCVLAYANGAEILRVHDVREVREALVVTETILGARAWAAR